MSSGAGRRVWRFPQKQTSISGSAFRGVRLQEVKTTKLALACPVCKSQDVFYSCTPNCCFNHVCADCGATFEPVTTLAGGTQSGIEPPDPLPDASDPTVACVKCDSIAVYVLPDGRLACAKCGSVLTLEITEVAPGA